MSKITSLFLATSALVLHGASASADPIALDFVAKTSNGTEAYMVGEADGVLHLISEWPPIAAPDQPLDGAAGNCFGIATMVAGKMTGEGHCFYTAVDGEKFTLRWWMANTAAPVGYWQFTGGTGKWASATGGGKWADSDAGSHITGTVEFH